MPINKFLNLMNQIEKQLNQLRDKKNDLLNAISKTKDESLIKSYKKEILETNIEIENFLKDYDNLRGLYLNSMNGKNDEDNY